MKNDVKNFRIINTIEGYSYLVLLFIAMPLKYVMGIAIATRIAGSIHGFLFILFMVLFFKAWQKAQWSMKENILFFVASLIPFGTFYTKSKIQAYE
jgi:integral membrane protein